MKKRFVLLHTGLLLLSFTCMKAQEQDPFYRIRSLAQSSPVLKPKIDDYVTITADNPLYQVKSRQAIPFQPFELIDMAGKSMNPDSLFTLPDGTQITLKNYLARLNQLEKQLNLVGYSLRQDSNILISGMYTAGSFKTNGTSAIGSKNGQTLIYIPLPAKPRSDGSGSSAAILDTAKIQKVSDVPFVYFKPDYAKTDAATIRASVSNLLLKNIYEETPYSMNLGNPSIVSAGLNLNFIRSAKIYSQNNENIQNNKSVMSLKANAEIKGSLFDKSFSIFSANASADAPADIGKNKTIDASVNVLGLTLYTFNKSFDASQSAYTAGSSYAKSLDKGVGINIPIFGPISFVGNIGVRGNVGIDYNITATYAPEISLSVKPVGELSVYGEVGVGFSDIATVGVGGNLILIRTNLNFTGAVGVANLYTPLANSFPLYLKYKLGMDLTMLNGNFYLFGRLCTPGFWGLPQICKTVTHEIFSWEGYKTNTTLAEGNYTWELKK